MPQTIKGNYISIGSIGNKTIGTKGDLLSVSTHGWWFYPYVSGDQEVEGMLSRTKKNLNLLASREDGPVNLMSRIIRDDDLISTLK